MGRGTIGFRLRFKTEKKRGSVGRAIGGKGWALETLGKDLSGVHKGGMVRCWERRNEEEKKQKALRNVAERRKAGKFSAEMAGTRRVKTQTP